MYEFILYVGVNGFHPPRVAEDIIWNRVANLTGRDRGNVGLDFVNELINNSYKGMDTVTISRKHATFIDAAVRITYLSIPQTRTTTCKSNHVTL